MKAVWFSDACAKTLRAGSRQADEWMARAPERLAELASAHGIELSRPLLGGHTGAVCEGSLDGVPVVCKLVLDRAFAVREARSLQYLKSSGRVPGVVAVDLSEGFLVTTRVLPGTTERAGDLDAVAELAGRLHAVAPVSDVHSVRDLVASRGEQLTQHCAELGLDPAYMSRARSALVLDDTGVVCHGDFGPANVLDGPAGALWAIDPECVIGPAAFDVAGWSIRQDSNAAIETATALARLCGVSEQEALAWLGWMAFDEAVSHTVYALPVAEHEWSLAETLGVLPART